MSGTRVLVVSPHLDDAAFSCGATLLALAARGHLVTVVTCFTASVPDPTGFALACQTDKGLPPDVDYMALRREEDDAAMSRLAVDRSAHLPFAEAPHRGYSSAPKLFAGVRAGDEVWRHLVEALTPYADDADLVLAPQALGDHVDHRQVVWAVRALDRDTAWWRDTPYAIRSPGAAPADGLTELPELAVDVAPHVEGKADACAAYVSQLGFQFGGEAAMREALYDLADAEGERIGTGRAAEVFRGSAAADRVLR